ncbi:MAG: TetR family transcriptional regulator [Pseudonocardia sp.]|nr:TetR family transcriptional regulator [Pseudonocardia sp.]
MSIVVEGEAIGRRERKKMATRAALSGAALRLSVQHGVDRVTVEQIADEADVAVRTFFNYFSSKEEAVAAGDLGTTVSLVEAFTARPADEALLDSLREAALLVVGGDTYRDRDRVEEMRAIRRAPALLPHRLAAYAEQERALAAAVASRTGTDEEKDLYPALVAATVMGGMRVVVQRWLAAPAGELDGPRLAELVETTFARLADGLAAPVQGSRQSMSTEASRASSASSSVE